MENIDNIWKAKRYLDNSTRTTTFVPTLEGHTTQNGKAKAIEEAFFPFPPPADLKDIHYASYPESVPFQQEITISQVPKAIHKLGPNKAPGPDEISNCILKNILPQIEVHLQSLTQASFNLTHFPNAFKESTTIILKKPNKPDYIKAKAYRSIALESTIGKVLEKHHGRSD